MTPTRQLHPTEFIALIAMLFATVAFSIDAMLPALPEIAQELTPDAPNQAQLILTSFVLGMGIGTLFAGPLSDAFGRKTVILAGSVLYCIGAAACIWAPTLETVLAARLVQGLGAAGARIVSQALIRDLFSGRQMARVMSFAMMVFTLVPAVAPLVGQGIIAISDWRGIFVAYLVFAAVSSLWLALRQPETLPQEKRRPLHLATLWAAMREVLSHRVILISIAVQTFCFASLFGTLSATQPIFEVTFGRGDSFPLWFAFIAVCAGSASFLNATVVVRLGMRFLINATLAALLALSLVMAAMTAGGWWPEALAFPAHILWTIGVFAMAGLTLGNLNALALEPVGHIAGMAASIVGAVATVVAVPLAAGLGLMFDGTALPLMLGVAVFSAAALGLMQLIRR